LGERKSTVGDGISDVSDFDKILSRARAAIDAYLAEPGDNKVQAALALALRVAGAEIASQPSRRFEGKFRNPVLGLLAAVVASGWHDLPVSDADLAQATVFSKKGAQGLIAAMLLTPAWQWSKAPALTGVPENLIADCISWIFTAPQGFTVAGHASLYPARYLARLTELLDYVRAKSGSPAAREALIAFLRRGNCIPLYFCEDSLRRHSEARAQIFQYARVRPAVELAPRPRLGRRLRVGFINRHFGPQTETYTTLPMFEQLDSRRFEVLLFAHHASGTPVEAYARKHSAGFTLLPADAGAQVDQLRAASLDVAVFGTNLTAVFNEVARVALHRIAPLQVVNNSSCTTTGFPEIDLYVSGTLTETPEAPAHFTERLGLVSGPAHAFNYRADFEKPRRAWTRAALGLPEDAIVFVSASNYFKIIPEMRHAWAKLLAATPGSRLFLHPFNPNWSSAYPIKRFAAAFDAVLAAHGVGPDRLVISGAHVPSRNDVKELLRVGDIYLDTFPFGGVNSLVDPLELGMPIVVWEGGLFRSRMGGALLRSLGLDQLIAAGETDYLSLATRLAGDRAGRGALRDRITAAMADHPVFLNAAAASDAFGSLLETAYDEILAVGRNEFRRRRAPVLAPASPRAAFPPPGAGPLGSPPKHVLLYSDDPEYGGVAQYNHNILLALAGRGYRVTCVQTRCDNPLVKEREARGVRHRWLDYHTGKDFARTLSDGSDARAIFGGDPPDLVIFSDCCPVSNMAARQAALDLGLPYLVVVNFVGAYLAKNFARQIPALSAQHARARSVVAVSGENLQLLHAHFGTPATQGAVIHYGRPDRFFRPRDAAVRDRLRAEQNIPADAVVCFTAARLTGVKGYAYQLDAIKLLQDRPGAERIYFVWAGDGDQRDAISRHIASLPWGGRIKLLGHRWDVADWYDASDIFVLPSEIEGMPLSIMEAMAKGLPVIATSVSGTPEELGDTGKLLPKPATDPQGVVRELARTIAAWAQSPAIRTEQGRRGRERADLMFRERLMVDRTLALVATHLAPAPAMATAV
jgi:glycosyltransferase involved in cell wall biosynthesis